MATRTSSPVSCRFPAPHRAGLIEAAAASTPPSQRSSFRLLTEPASLKPRRAPAGQLLADRGFRLLTEPASLKRMVRLLVYDPGGCFRLLTEPASLKPSGRTATLRTNRRAFPAPHRAGLIEASRRGTPASGPGTAGFRLLTEPASLKRRTAASDDRRDQGSFRLLTEPASLKPRRQALQVPAGCLFPAPHRAGLIEASRISAEIQRSSGFRLLTEPASLKRIYSVVEYARARSFRLLTEPASLKPGRA